MIFQALDGLLDLAASTNAQSSNDGHPGYRVDNMYDMRFLVDHDHNDSVSGDIDFFFSTVFKYTLVLSLNWSFILFWNS